MACQENNYAVGYVMNTMKELIQGKLDQGVKQIPLAESIGISQSTFTPGLRFIPKSKYPSHENTLDTDL
jgi:hypothetical protein